MKALLIGRFQPFHKGHLSIIKKILTDADELIIVIGSSQHANTINNPFTAEEREEMIRRALKEERGHNVRTFKVQDINDDDKYPGHVMKLVPDFDVIYSGNSLVQRLFKEAGKEVRTIELIKGELYSGSEIRKRMTEGEGWEQLVPKPVATFLNEIKGVERVKRLWT